MFVLLIIIKKRIMDRKGRDGGSEATARGSVYGQSLVGV